MLTADVNNVNSINTGMNVNNVSYTNSVRAVYVNNVNRQWRLIITKRGNNKLSKQKGKVQRIRKGEQGMTGKS